jgi:hypothetical protein
MRKNIDQDLVDQHHTPSLLTCMNSVMILWIFNSLCVFTDGTETPENLILFGEVTLEKMVSVKFALKGLKKDFLELKVSMNELEKLQVELFDIDKKIMRVEHDLQEAEDKLKLERLQDELFELEDFRNDILDEMDVIRREA